MPDRFSRLSRRALAVLATVVLVAGCSSSDGEFHGNKLDPPFEASPVALTDTDGDAYALDRTDNDLTLVFFGYTHCPDICQTVMSTLASAMTRLDERDRDRVDVIFVTTDPARDTEQLLTVYLSHFDPSFLGLTGDLDDIVAAAKPFGIGVENGEKLPSGGYDVTHGTTITGVEPGGDAPVYWGQETSSAEFASDIHQLLED